MDIQKMTEIIADLGVNPLELSGLLQKFMTNQEEAMKEFQALNISPEKIAKFVSFIQENEASLRQMASAYGVSMDQVNQAMSSMKKDK